MVGPRKAVSDGHCGGGVVVALVWSCLDVMGTGHVISRNAPKLMAMSLANMAPEFEERARRAPGASLRPLHSPARHHSSNVLLEEEHQSTHRTCHSASLHTFVWDQQPHPELLQDMRNGHVDHLHQKVLLGSFV